MCDDQKMDKTYPLQGHKYESFVSLQGICQVFLWRLVSHVQVLAISWKEGQKDKLVVHRQVKQWRAWAFSLPRQVPGLHGEATRIVECLPTRLIECSRVGDVQYCHSWVF